jgi:hypothetical protein
VERSHSTTRGATPMSARKRTRQAECTSSSVSHAA